MKKLTILFALLLSIPALAEYRVEVRDLDEKLTHSADFATQEEAQSWAAFQSASGNWGENEHLVRLDGASDEDRALALEVIPADSEAGTPSMLRVRKKYSYTTTDVTANVNAEKALAAGMAAALKAMECGKSTQALLLVRNAGKNLSTSQVKALLASYAPIKGMLDTGSLASAVEEIQAVQADGVVITESDKTALIAHINACKP